MSLVTRCPRCKTLFRVTPPQLQARAGHVRCGRCMHVFDGFQALAVQQANAMAEAVRLEPPAQDTLASPAARPAVPEASVPASAIQSTAAANTLPPKPETLRVPRTPLTTRLREYWSSRVAAPLSERLARKPSEKTKWGAACAMLAFVLVIQMTYVFRSDIAARYSGFHSALNVLCAIAGCGVTLPQRPNLVRIEASDVHMIDSNRPSLIQVTATLRSYASYHLAYPALDLVLTNSNEHALARRVFVPEEYLGQARDPRMGIPPRGEVTVALDLDTGDLNAAGFRLDLLAAPAP